MGPSLPDICAGILVGGRGRRLGGVDKARLTNQGRSFVAILVERLRSELVHLALLGRTDQKYDEVDCPLWPDAKPDSGPLGGLVTLLNNTPVDWVFLLACDMPSFDVSLLLALADARTEATDVVVPEHNGRLHCTAALYHRRILPLASGRLQSGGLSMRELVGALKAVHLPVTAALATTLANVNRPGDHAPI